MNAHPPLYQLQNPERNDAFSLAMQAYSVGSVYGRTEQLFDGDTEAFGTPEALRKFAERQFRNWVDETDMKVTAEEEGFVYPVISLADLSHGIDIFTHWFVQGYHGDAVPTPAMFR